MNTRTANGAVACLGLLVLGLVAARSATQNTRGTVAQHNAIANFLHGTTVLVISAKDGFVLAGDSRASYRNCGAVPGEFEKVFSVADRAGIVTAGMIQNSDSTGHVVDAIATQMHRVPQVPSGRSALILQLFKQTVRNELSIFEPGDFIGLPNPIAAASVVYIDKNGATSWATLYLDWIVYAGPTGMLVNTKVEEFIDDPPSSKIQVIGSGASFVNGLIMLEESDPTQPYSEEPVLRKYYALKKAGKLSELTLEDGKTLANVLIKAAIDWSATHPCTGVGGSIDILTVTKAGNQWAQRKTEIVPPPPNPGLRISDEPMWGKIDAIGATYFRITIPANKTITYDGGADVSVIAPKFEGPCTFVIGGNAERVRPETTKRLVEVFKSHCDVFRQSGAELVKLSTATAPTGQPPAKGPGPQMAYARIYACLSNTELKKEFNDLLALANVIDGRLKAVENQRFQRRATGSDPPSDADLVRGLKEDLAVEDAENQWMSDFYSQIVPKAVPMQAELIKRLDGRFPTPPHMPSFGVTWGSFGLQDYFDRLGPLVPDSSKKPEGCQ